VLVKKYINSTVWLDGCCVHRFKLFVVTMGLRIIEVFLGMSISYFYFLLVVSTFVSRHIIEQRNIVLFTKM